MKKIIYLTVLFILFSSTSSYAIMDMEVFSGYSFAGDMGNLETTEDVSGPDFGFRFDALYRIEQADFGLGSFMQFAPLTYKINDEEYELNKLSIGIDSFARYKNEKIPVYPYVRFGTAVYDKTENKLISGENITVTEFRFKSYYFGAGVSYPLVPMPVIDVHAFIEYLYDISSIADDQVLKRHRVNIGLFMAL